MPKVKLTITESRCRSDLCRAGETYVVEDRCPPHCQELWHNIYPYVFALQNGAALDHGESRRRAFDAACPDGGRVRVHGEIIAEEEYAG